MHARITRFQVPPTAVDAGIDDFRASSAPAINQQGGKTMLLVNRETGDSAAISFWEDEASMRGSEKSTSTLRDDAVAKTGASVSGIDRYEVVVSDL